MAVVIRSTRIVAAVGLLLVACNQLLGIELGEPYPDGGGAGPSTGGASSGARLLWVKQVSGPKDDDAADVAHASGRILVAGTFDDTVSFDGKITLTGPTGHFSYLASYDDDGAIQWAKALPASEKIKLPPAVATNNDGAGILITSSFAGTGTFGDPGDPGYAKLTAATEADAFVARYDRDGKLQWVRVLGGAATGLDIALWGDASLVAGVLWGSLSTNPKVSSQGGSDAFFVALDATGAPQAAGRVGGPLEDYAFGVAMDGSRLFVTGIFQGEASVDVTGQALKSAGKEDVFLTAWELSGKLAWAKRFGGSEGDYARGLRARITGQVLMAGEYQSADYVFGDLTDPDGTLSPAQESDVYLAAFDADDGKLQWARSSGGPGLDNSKMSVGLATSLAGDVAITGTFPMSATFGKGEPTETVLSSAGSFDVFFARYDNTGALISATSAGGPGEEWGLDVVLPSSGGLVVVGEATGDDAVFGRGQANETKLSTVSRDGFVARYEL